MKKLEFPTQEAFLKELDGEVYAISDNKGKFVCNILEEDYLKLRENGEVVNLDTSRPKKLQGVKSFSQYVLYDDYTDVMLARFKEQYGVEIVIASEKKLIYVAVVNTTIDYEEVQGNRVKKFSERDEAFAWVKEQYDNFVEYYDEDTLTTEWSPVINATPKDDSDGVIVLYSEAYVEGWYSQHHFRGDVIEFCV